MTNGLPREVAERIKSDRGAAPSNDKLDDIRRYAVLMRDYEVEIADLTERLEIKTAALNVLKTKSLPELMEEAGVSSIAVEAEGNNPAFDVKIKPKYIASIPKSLDPVKREEAFAELSARGGGDLIKTVVSFSFPKDSEDDVKAFLEFLAENFGDEVLIPRPSVEMSVNHASYSSWLREEWEGCAKAGRPMPDLGKLNAMVIRLAELKFKKER